MSEKSKTDKWRKILAIGILVILVALSIFVYFFWGTELIEFVKDSERVRGFVDARPVLSRMFFIGVVFLQVVFAIIPGEPFELAAGYAFGSIEGCIICILGILIASTLIFMAVKKFGRPAVELFFSPEKIDNIKVFQNKNKLNFIIFLIFFIPGTPKDILTYMVGLTPMRLRDWIFITMIARIPSIITSTIAGSVFAEKNTKLAIIVFMIGAVIAGIGMLIFYFWNKRYGESKSAEAPKQN